MRAARLYSDCSVDQAEVVAALRCFLCLRDVPAGKVRRSGVKDLSLRAKDFVGFPDLVPRRRSVDVVHLVDVDVVGLQPAQRCLAGALDVQGGKLAVVRPLAHVAVELGRDDRALAASVASREPVTDDALGHALVLTPAVDVGRVEEVDAELVGAVHDVVTVGHLGDRAEVHGAETEPAHREAGAAEMCVVHISSLPREVGR